MHVGIALALVAGSKPSKVNLRWAVVDKSLLATDMCRWAVDLPSYTVKLVILVQYTMAIDKPQLQAVLATATLKTFQLSLCFTSLHSFYCF